MSFAHNSEASTSNFHVTSTAQPSGSKYRTYVSAVDKALKSFENTTEWADLISALGKLCKVFSTNGKHFNDIPNCVTVAKRLSQCLHPHLPSGVHLKALDTYRQVFLILGRTENLPKYLYLFAIGLFPLMDHCGIKVKSELLSIFEQLLLPLGIALRPTLPGFIATVLLGLEEGTEFYSRSFLILEQVIDRVGEKSFYACFWQAVHGSSSVRLPALMFLNAKLEKRKGSGSNKLHEFSGGNHTNYMIQSLCAVAEDSGSTLIQRHLLDFLSATFPLNSTLVSKKDLGLILQRCLFVVLRRDMSLNRRLYQWLLNRWGDGAFASLPLNGTEEVVDMNFFLTYSLPLIKNAIKDFLKANIVEIVPSSSILMGASKLKTKDTQLQFVEVRVCRLIHYLMDRREIGIKVLNETLSMYLEFSCQHDSVLIEEINEQCEELDSSYECLWNYSSNTNESLNIRRITETKKTFNLLLNSLEPSFLWQFLENYLLKLLNNESDDIKNDDFNAEEDNISCDEKEMHLKFYPLIVAFCLKHIQLDSHNDIRSRYLTSLLYTIIKEICRKGCDVICRDILIALLVVMQKLLQEINQSVFIFEGGLQNQPSLFNRKDTIQKLQQKKDCIEEQMLVESCLGVCFNLLSDICRWYLKNRERDKTGVLCAIITLIRDFSNFPFYSFQPNGFLNTTIPSISDRLRLSDDTFTTHCVWLNDLISVVDADSWVSTIDLWDFNVRARMLDLILYLYVCSNSVIEQHSNLFGQTQNSSQYYSSNYTKNVEKKTTTVLLKPFFSKRDLFLLENDNIFKKTSLVLWARLGDNIETNLQTSAFLLLRLHSRKVSHPSSEVEDIIVSELTSSDKTISCLAAKKFRDLWVFCRSAGLEDVYTSVPLKSMNRVVMVLLGFIADDLVGTERIELRAIAYAWFVDCSRHNDLHKILQMLLLMLVNPASARVSIQFVQIDSRISCDQINSMPFEANAISFVTDSKQKFYHICCDIDVKLPEESVQSNASSWNNFTYIDCNSSQQWVSDLKKQLLLPSNTFVENLQNLIAPSTSLSTGTKTVLLSHKRTMSDIPQFDEDAESVGSFSLDSSIEHEIFEAIQFIIDTIIDDELRGKNSCASKSTRDNSFNSTFASKFTSNSVDANSNVGGKLLTSSFHNHIQAIQNPGVNASSDDNLMSKSANSIKNLNNVISEELSSYKPGRLNFDTSRNSLTSDQASVVSTTRDVVNNTLNDNTSSIKRIKCGHRRQDSLQESIFSQTTQELRLFDPAELPSSTCPGDSKQPLLDETHSYMLFYAESPRIVDLGRAEKIFRTIGALLKSGYSLGRHIVNCLIFTNTANLKASGTSQLVDYMVQHYRHMQGGGFWSDDIDLSANGGTSNNSIPTIIPGSDKSRNPTMFEIFATILLYYFRSYYLNSPTNYVSQEDLIMSWKCKIAALDCFTELLRILNDIVKEVNSRDFVSFVQQIYRFTRTQRVVIALMLTAVPSPPSQKDWRMPITVDIAAFNNGPQTNHQFRDLIFAYHRSLLNLSFSLVVLEFNMQMGVKNFATQNLGLIFERPMENRQLYNSPANRSTIRDPRYMVVELRMFISVILNALKRCPERHELWLQFLISVVPYLDRALPTFAVHVVEQICRNIYVCIFYSLETNLNHVQSSSDLLESPKSIHNFSGTDFKTAFYFADFRLPKKEISNSNSGNSINTSSHSSLASLDIKFPANYAVILMESLMSILHFCMIDSAAVSMPFLIAKTSNNHNTYTTHHHSASSMFSQNSLFNYNNPNTAISSNTFSTGGSSSNMVGSMVGSAISVLPGTTAISNLFGKVFMSGDSSGSQVNASTSSNSCGLSESWIVAQKELIKIFPSALAILCDVWSFNSLKKGFFKSTTVGNSDALISLVIDTLNPIAKKHINVLINAFSIVWISRKKFDNYKTKLDTHQPSFVYSNQQISVAKLLLSLKVLSLNSIIIATAEVLKEFANKSTKICSGFLSEVALLELLHECTRQVPVNDLRESWSALNILFNESPLSLLPARSTFLQFAILSDFVRRCGSQAIIEDRQISRAILDVCQKLTDAMNTIVGWQLESTTWLKRTLVVRQDAASQKQSDINQTLDMKGNTAVSEASSMRGSTMSLVSSTNRISLDSMNQFNGSVNQLSLNSSDSTKKSLSNLRSSLKDASVNKKDPTDSTQALFLLAENLAELIDSISKSEDKEKLLPILQAVWVNTLPYLKAKNAKNVRFFLASSQFLASMSSFNYMRPVWKKTTMDLLLDSGFFKMDIHALKQWLVVIDNLMTNDKISFKELLARITTGTSSSLSNLITSKEQEYEMRAQSLKRLAFVILSSEVDQYCAQLNEIQERLSENLRVSQVPVVNVQVFTCYRVLLVRMRPSSFVSMWPSMVTELVQVLTQIEQQLQQLNNSNMVSVGSNSIVSNINNTSDDLKCSRDDYWMQLYLAACKLLETLCTLPSGYVSQFQVCRWAFVSALSSNSISDVFVPFAVRINLLLNLKYNELSTVDRELRSASLFNIKTLTSFEELHPFFYALSNQHSITQHLSSPTITCDNLGNSMHTDSATRLIGCFNVDSENDSQFRDTSFINGSLTLNNAVSRIEQSLYVDFADHWQL